MDERGIPDRIDIRPARPADTDAILRVINDAASAYEGAIAPDCWQVPYMPFDELRDEMAAGVAFWVREVHGRVVAVMGLQEVGDVALIRHAYVLGSHQRQGHGSALLAHIRARTPRPILVGTWRAATWAVRFYRDHGFHLLDESDTVRLLRQYWTVSARQMEESVVLADERWVKAHGR